jgi:hypothetical protein
VRPQSGCDESFGGDGGGHRAQSYGHGHGQQQDALNPGGQRFLAGDVPRSELPPAEGEECAKPKRPKQLTQLFGHEGIMPDPLISSVCSP